LDDQKVIRDPVYNLITFLKNPPFDVLLKLIDTHEFQRLRRIKQLGFSYITYPTAVHDRFSHSIGVAYLTGEIIDRLNGLPNEISFDDSEGTVTLSKEEFKLLLQVAGLLHDIGHGPFSHAFEKAANIDHQAMGVRIIRDERTEINQILRSIDSPNLKGRIVNWVAEIIEGTFNVAWARDLISGQIDADRMDYLHRDAYMCGVPYARFDRQWLLGNMKLMKIGQEERQGIVMNAQKGLYALESFIVSRYHMYEQVYFHKTTRGMEQIAAAIFRRAKDILKKNGGDDNIDFVDESIQNFFKNSTDTNSEIDIADFLGMDDSNMLTQIKAWTRHKDDILNTLCKAVIDRKPFKMFKEETGGALFSREQYRELDKQFSDTTYSDYYFLQDDYISNPYKDDYLLGKGAPEDAGHIWLLLNDGNIKELAEESILIKSLRNQVTKRSRAYIHRNYAL
jgi:HD superfamily phosphohydrolase